MPTLVAMLWVTIVVVAGCLRPAAIAPAEPGAIAPAEPGGSPARADRLLGQIACSGGSPARADRLLGRSALSRYQGTTPFGSPKIISEGRTRGSRSQTNLRRQSISRS